MEFKLTRTLGRIVRDRDQIPAVRRSPRVHWYVTGTVCIGAFMGQLDTSIVSLALPSLVDELHATIGAVEWVALAYALVLIAAIVLVGHIGDAVGHDVLYLGGFVVFTIGSVLCGFAPSLPVLIGMRVLQALGAALLQANSVALINEAAPPDALERAMGWRVTAYSVGLACGPGLGGVLLSLLGWRWLFWLNLPVGVVGVGLGWTLLPGTRIRRAPELGDWLGALLLPLATALSLVYLSVATSLGYDNPLLLLALVGAVAFGAWFATHERRTKDPLVSPALFRVPALTAGLVASLVSFAALFGTLTAVAYFLSAEHVEAWMAGIQLVVLPASIAVTMPLVRLGSRRQRALGRPTTALRRTAAGAACVGLALVWIAIVHGMVPLLAGLAVAGIGQGLGAPANDTGIIRAAPPGRSGMIAGIMNMTRSMGSALGVTIVGLAYVAAGGGHRAAADASAERGLAASVGTLGTAQLATAAALVIMLAWGRRRPAGGRSRGGAQVR